MKEWEINNYYERAGIMLGKHFCNASMFKTITQIEMYIRSKKKGELKILNREESIHYYMTEYGQVFKFNKEKFKSYELDLQNMVWFQKSRFCEDIFRRQCKVYRDKKICRLL